MGTAVGILGSALQANNHNLLSENRIIASHGAHIVLCTQCLNIGWLILFKEFRKSELVVQTYIYKNSIMPRLH